MAEVEIKVTIDGVEYTQSQLKDLAKNGEKAAESMDEVKEKTKEAADEGTLLGDFKQKFSDMTSGITKVVKSFKTLKGAIAATGIGALVLAIGSLISYFKSSEEGSRKLAIATEALSVIFGKLMEFVGQLGEMLVWVFENPKEALMNFTNLIKENIVNRFEGLLELIPALGNAIGELFSGNFKEAGKIAADAVGKATLGVENVTDKAAELGEKAVEAFGDMKDAVNEAVEVATKLVDAQRALRNQQQELVVENAKLNQQLELQQKIAEDTTLSYEERKAALENVGNAQVQLAANVAKQAKAEEDLLRTQIAYANTYEEREELETQLAEATASRIEAQTALGIIQQDVSKITRELDLEELERKKAINAQIQDLALANLDNERQIAFEELKIAEQTALDELELLRATEEEKQKVRDEYQKIREGLEEEYQTKINERLDALRLENLDNELEAARQKIAADEEAALAELEQFGATEEQKQQLRALYAQQRADLEQSTQDKINEILLQADLQSEENQFAKAQKELEIAEQAQLAELTALEATEEEKQKIVDFYTSRREKLAQQETEFKKKLKQEEVNAALNASQGILNGIVSLVGEGSAIGKAAAIASTTIETYKSATAAYAATVGIPVVGPVLAPIAAGVAVAAGIANVNKIISTEIPGSEGAGGGGGGGPRPTAPATPTFQANTGSLDLSTFGAVGAGSTGAFEELQPPMGAESEPAPIKTYVVATEMTDAQEANKKIEDIAKL